MQFSSLRLVGFKSFVEPTEVPIAPGITGVVGPNGCGKSNLVEALRWVMGEASARRLRGGDMDDVIFGGTLERPARNLAEVSVTLDNGERRAPPNLNDADELEISRRIERGSGSSYRINGRVVRARDVQLLFQDSNSGAASASLVSQGRVGALIAARPSERRVLLEEAAGIQGLHSRRHDAELRLRAAENNLERLEDVIGAMDTQLAGLKKQVRQTVRYRNLSERIRKTEASVLLLRWQGAQARLLATQDAFAAADGVVIERSRAVFGATKAAEAAREALGPCREAAAERGAAVQRLVLERQALDAEEKRVADLAAETEAAIAQADSDRSRESDLAGDAQAAMDRLAEEQAAIAAAQTGEKEAAAAADEAVAVARTAADQVEEALTALTAKMAEADTAARDLEARRTRILRRRDDNARRCAELDKQVKAVSAEIAAAPPLTEAEAAVTAAEAAAAAARDSVAKLAGDRDAAEQVRQSAIDTVRGLDAQRARLSGEAEGLRSALASDRDTRFPPVIDQFQVPEGMETALGAILGDELQISLVPDARQHWSSRGADIGEMAPLPPGAEPLIDHVTGPSALGRRLGQIGLVENRDAAVSLIDRLGPGQSIVTRDGSWWRWDGLQASAGEDDSAARRLKQRNRLATLDDQIAGLAGTLADARAAAEAATAARDRLKEQVADADRAVRAADKTLETARSTAVARAREDATRRSRLAALDESLGQARIDGEAIAEEAAGVEAEVEALPDRTALKAEADGVRAKLAEQRAHLAAQQRSRDALRREAAERSRRLKAAAEDAQRWQTRAEGAVSRLKEIDARIATARERLDGLKSVPGKLAGQRKGLLSQLEKAEAEKKQAEDAVAGREGESRVADQALKAAESAMAEAREARVRADADISGAKAAAEALRERISDRLDCQPQGLAVIAEWNAEADHPPIEAMEETLAKLNREREALGPVNLRAETEAAELDERIAALTTERADLLAAIGRLRQAIASLNKEARERLIGSFEKVDGFFRQLFSQLFGGGNAHLKLIDSEDPLSAGLEIYASPPGKRLQSLTLLSGGEQALTAIALLFAAFLTNPAPICVLDEVDAPLDDANVDRFCSLVERIAEDAATRFIVVTHHRMTMARADRLYGVTMPERGVSQLVSVDLQQARRFAGPRTQTV